MLDTTGEDSVAFDPCLNLVRSEAGSDTIDFIFNTHLLERSADFAPFLVEITVMQFVCVWLVILNHVV